MKRRAIAALLAGLSFSVLPYSTGFAEIDVVNQEILEAEESIGSAEEIIEQFETVENTVEVNEEHPQEEMINPSSDAEIISEEQSEIVDGEIVSDDAETLFAEEDELVSPEEEPELVGAPGEEISDNVNTTEGTCGANLKWTCKDNVLTITGTGAMTDYDDADSPFDSLAFTSLVVEEGVTDIGRNAFDSCESLQSISFPSTLKTIGDQAFQNCTALKTLTVPMTVSSIGEEAFYGCTALKTLTLQGNTGLGDSAFADCGLESVSMSMVRYVGTAAFQNCSNLKSVSMDQARQIGAWAFFQNTSLTYVKMSRVEAIGEYAFGECGHLTTLEIGTDLKSVYSGAFYGCQTLNTVNYSGTQSQWDAIGIGSNNDPLIKALKKYNTAHSIPVYRLYNRVTGEHLYTTDTNERLVQLTRENSQWNDEGIGWYASSGTSGTPVYRIFNPKTGEHHYTADNNEVRVQRENGWNYEGIAFYYSKKAKPVYRLYLPGNTNPLLSHHYTTQERERNALLNNGWNNEGICWYSEE